MSSGFETFAEIAAIFIVVIWFLLIGTGIGSNIATEEMDKTISALGKNNVANGEYFMQTGDVTEVYKIKYDRVATQEEVDKARKAAEEYFSKN